MYIYICYTPYAKKSAEQSDPTCTMFACRWYFHEYCNWLTARHHCEHIWALQVCWKPQDGPAMQVGSLNVVQSAELELASVYLTAKGRYETAPAHPARLGRSGLMILDGPNTWMYGEPWDSTFQLLVQDLVPNNSVERCCESVPGVGCFIDIVTIVSLLP